MYGLLRKILPVIPLAVMAACTAAPRYHPPPPAPRPTRSDVYSGDVIQEARKFIGVPYRAGGVSLSGVDCSGLVTTVYKKFGIALPRTSREQATFGRKIDRSELKPGDLVFFRTSGNTTVSHVGIYSGRGEFIHASTRSKRVRYDRLDNKYFKRRYVTARRVL